MNEHSETIPGERTSRTPVVQQHPRTAECDGFHGRCPDDATQMRYERDQAIGQLENLRAQLAEMQRKRDYLGERFLWYENDRDKWREAAGSVTAELDAARSARTAAGELLKRAADALWNSSKAALTVEPVLKVPYPDDPRWSPWTRWVERPAREAHDAAMAIRKHLRGLEPAAAACCPDSGTCSHAGVGTEGAAP